MNEKLIENITKIVNACKKYFLLIIITLFIIFFIILNIFLSYWNLERAIHKLNQLKIELENKNKEFNNQFASKINRLNDEILNLEKEINDLIHNNKPLKEKLEKLNTLKRIIESKKLELNQNINIESYKSDFDKADKYRKYLADDESDFQKLKKIRIGLFAKYDENFNNDLENFNPENDNIYKEHLNFFKKLTDENNKILNTEIKYDEIIRIFKLHWYIFNKPMKIDQEINVLLKRLEDNPTVALKRNSQEQNQHKIDSIINKKDYNLLKEDIKKMNNEISKISETISILKKELRNVYKISEFPVTATTIIPIAPLIIIILLLWFLIHFNHLKNSLNSNEFINSTDNNNFYIQFYLLYKEKFANILSYLSLFTPSIFMLFVLTVIVAYIQPTIEKVNKEIQCDIFLINDFQIGLLIACTTIILGLNIILIIVRKKILKLDIFKS